MQGLVQTVHLCVILPEVIVNYKGTTQTWVIIVNFHCHAFPYPWSLLYTTLYIA